MHKVMIGTTIAAVALIFGGCAPGERVATKTGPAANLAMQYELGQTGTYNMVFESWRTAKFEGPELSKEPQLRSGRTGGCLQMQFTQEITAVNPDGSAIARITIKSLKYDAEVSSEVTHAFDSAGNINDPMANLVGKSYTIRLMPNGTAVADDMTAVRGAIAGGVARDLITVLFSDMEVARMHTIAALPDTPTQRVG
ncbi:MAG TPA: hypothetical protein VLH60_02555, partial [Sedimentisphaerales bacterium]|nr:hypothetical protein [Sedimentisphaerales bacterium]